MTLQAGRCIFLRAFPSGGCAAAAASPVEGRLRLPPGSAEGQRLIIDHLHPAKNIPEPDLRKEGVRVEEGPPAYSFAHHLQGNRRHTREALPGQGAIFTRRCPIFDQQSRWLECTCTQSRSLPQLLKVPLIHLPTWEDLLLAHWPPGQGTSQVLENTLDTLLHNVLGRESDGTVPQVQACQCDNISCKQEKTSF